MTKKLTSKERKTKEYYDRTAGEWASEHLTHKFWGSMDKFYELLPSGKVIEIGCGGGRDAKDYLIGKYDYVGTDVSEGLLAEARKRNPKSKFLNQSVYNLDFPENTFDGFWAAAVLLHIPKRRIDEALGKIHEVVKNKEVGFISLKQGEGEREDEKGRWFAYYSKEEFDKILSDDGFEIVGFNLQPMTEKTIWLIYLVRVKK